MPSIDLNDLELFPLEGPPSGGFTCSRAEQNDFFHDRAWKEQQQGFSVTYLAHYGGLTVGYITVAMDAIPLKVRERPSPRIKLVRFPAVKLAQLAVHERWESQGIGKQLVALAVGLGLDLRHRVGCRYLTVDAKQELRGWYEDQQFKANDIERAERQRRATERGVDPSELPVNMRLDLFHFLADLQDRYPADFRRE